MQVGGRAGNGRRTYNGRDCGIMRGGSGPFRLQDVDANGNVDPGCGCGPNLIYCIYYPESTLPLPRQNDGILHYPDGQRRLIWEEPARLFAHIITHDKPFSDLVLGDYTVVTSRLQHAYVRSGRPESNATDNDTWWKVPDTKAWREVKYERMNPLKVTGDLTIKDITKPVTLDVELSNEIIDPFTKATKRAVTATGSFKRADYNMTWNMPLANNTGVVVGEEVNVTLDLEFVKKEGKQVAGGEKEAPKK